MFFFFIFFMDNCKKWRKKMHTFRWNLHQHQPQYMKEFVVVHIKLVIKIHTLWIFITIIPSPHNGYVYTLFWIDESHSHFSSKLKHNHLYRLSIISGKDNYLNGMIGVHIGELNPLLKVWAMLFHVAYSIRF